MWATWWDLRKIVSVASQMWAQRWCTSRRPSARARLCREELRLRFDPPPATPGGALGTQLHHSSGRSWTLGHRRRRRGSEGQRVPARLALANRRENGAQGSDGDRRQAIAPRRLPRQQSVGRARAPLIRRRAPPASLQLKARGVRQPDRCHSMTSAPFPSRHGRCSSNCDPGSPIAPGLLQPGPRCGASGPGPYSWAG